MEYSSANIVKTAYSSSSRFEVISLKEAGINIEVEETGTTFLENAFIKARAIYKITKTPTIADDSGLCVDYLGGAPGVYSARYAGENASDQDNIDKLLAEIQKYPDRERSAKFVCSLCVCRPDGETLYVNGESEGLIIDEMRGDGRFGYDPIFYYPPFDKTFAEMTSEEKNSISHRGRAIKKLLQHKDFFEK